MINLDNANFDNFMEKQLFQLFSDAIHSSAMNNNILEVKNFKKWCKKNYNRIDSWLYYILDGSQNELCEKRLITEVTQEEKSLFGKIDTVKHKIVTTKLLDEAIKLKGLKKFLLDFSTMQEKEFVDVHLWENYLIFAQLFGISKRVEKQFSKTYPDFNKQAIFDTDITVALNISHICYSGMTIGFSIYNAETTLSNIVRNRRKRARSLRKSLSSSSSKDGEFR